MFGVSWKREARVFGYLFKVQFMYWRQNIMNLFLGLGVSLYTMVCWLAFKSDDPFLMISGLCVGMVRNAMYIHLKATGDFKAQGLYKRYDVAPINPMTRILAVIAFDLFSTIAIVLFMFCIALIFWHKTQVPMLQNSNQGIVWSGIILTWITSMIVCYFIVAFVKARFVGQMIGLFLYFSTMYFLGLGFPFASVISADWLNWILYFHPFRYVMNITQAGFVNGGHWQLQQWWDASANQTLIHAANSGITFGDGGWGLVNQHGLTNCLFNPVVPNVDFFGDLNGAHVKGVDTTHPFETLNMGFNGKTYLPYVLAIVVMIVYATSTYIKTFWSLAFHKRDKYGRFVVNKSSSRYLHHIKDAHSVEELEARHNQRIRILEETKPELIPMIKQVEREMRVEELFKWRRKKKKELAKKADK